MNNGLDKIRIIEPGALDGEFYFQSLIEQAQIKELLNEAEIERLQYECLALLAKKAERYNSGFSSSLRVEKAQSMMASGLFTIGVCLKTYPSPDDAITALKSETVDDLYQKGRERIDTLLTSAKMLYQNLLRNLAEIKNVFYRATIEGGIKGFFKLYDPDYSAQEIHITADYPTCLAVPKLTGIEFITAYLNRLYLENLFCLIFAPEDIHHLMCGYNGEYEELLINVFEQVFIAAIGCVLAGTDPRRLDVSGSEMLLYRQFEGLSDRDISELIQTAAQKLDRIFNLSPQLYGYIKSCLPSITDKVKSATDRKQLDKVFFNPDYPNEKPELLYSFGEKMPDAQYRKVLEEIDLCRFSQDKIAVIRESVHSLADMEDILLDAELTHEEVMPVLGSLGLPELAALSKRYQLQAEIGEFGLSEQEQNIREYLKEHITGMPQKQREAIEQMVKVIREE